MKKYRLIVSKVVSDECASGDPDAAAKRLAVLESLTFVATTPAVDDLASQLIDGLAVPKTEPAMRFTFRVPRSTG